MEHLVKVLIAATLISFVSWLSGTRTVLAGFLTALPLTSILTLVFSHLRWGSTNPAHSFEYAKSIFVAVPVSLLFFLPFLVAEKFHLGFWAAFILGLFLLGLGYLLFRMIA